MREKYAAKRLIAALLSLIWSKHDLNGDNTVNHADLSLAFYYYQSKDGDDNWGEAARADTGAGSGAVNMVDLVAIYANFV